jgi:ribosomal protein S18 acetylase RimI-like enzyme
MGVAKELLGHVLRHDDAAFLWVAATNARAIRFYEKNAFVFDGARHVDGYEILEVRMVRRGDTGRSR